MAQSQSGTIHQEATNITVRQELWIQPERVQHLSYVGDRSCARLQ